MNEICPKCDGCGAVATSEDEEPWKDWVNLPPGSDLAVRLGLVKPKACPKCGGSGKLGADRTSVNLTKHIENLIAVCGEHGIDDHRILEACEAIRDQAP